MNSTVRLLCDTIEQICDRQEAGDCGQPGDCLYDELDAVVSLLSYVRDRIDDPAAYLTLATKRPAAGQLMATIHSGLLALADARWTVEELLDQAVDAGADLRVQTAGKIETATMPEGELRAAL